MSISKRIKALLSLQGLKQSELMLPLNMGSRQALSNKFTNERWSAADLVRVAEACGCRLAFILPDGERIYIDTPDQNSPDA